jgi:hypothetical protein
MNTNKSMVSVSLLPIHNAGSRASHARRWIVPGLALASALGLLLSPPGVVGQVSHPSASAGVSVESYRFSDEGAVALRSVLLTTLPFSAGADLHPSVRLQVRGAYASGRMDRPDGSTTTLGSLTDTEIQLEARVGPDRFRMAGIFLLPTGHSRYTAEEADLAGIVAADVLPFRITNWGSGGGFGLHSSLAGTVGPVGLGVSTSYLVGREFEVFSGEDVAFRPGDQLTLALAADRNVGRAGKAALQLRMTRYGEDELAGSNLYRSGLRYQVLGSYAFAAPGYSSALAYAGVMHRSQGTFLSVPDSVASQNLLTGGAVMRMPFSWGVLVPGLELQALRRSDGTGQGYTATLGGSAERAMGTLMLVPTLRVRFGQVVVFEGARTGFSGLEVGLSTRFGRAGS